MRDATVKVFVSIVKQSMVSESFKWFNLYVTTYLGNRNDSYITRHNLNSNLMVMLGSNLNSQHAQLKSFLEDIDTNDVVQTKRRYIYRATCHEAAKRCNMMCTFVS